MLFSLGPCPACGAARAAPLCSACVAESAATKVQVAPLGSCALHFAGSYHVQDRAAPRGLSPLGKSLRAFKDHGDRYAGRCLAEFFAWRCANLTRGLDLIVPVPADTERLRRRGFNPAAWLASGLSRASGARMCTNALVRRPGHPPQRTLGGSARRANAADAFELGAADLRGYSVALVDDVVTTGATMLDAVRCIAGAPAAAIVCFALACADSELVERCRSKTGHDGSSATSAN